LLEGFGGLRVMVAGDLGLDHYLVGNAGRISREYPVIILTHERDEYRLGGAANTVNNLTSLGATVVPVGWIGADPNGGELLRLLAQTGCDAKTIVRDPATRTVTKIRIVAGSAHDGGLSQHLLRVDMLGTGSPGGAAEAELLRLVEVQAGAVDGFVLSDYGGGAVTPELAGTVVRLAAGRYVGLDSRHRLLDFPGVTAATPNLEEAEEAVGVPLESTAEIERAGTRLREELLADALLITRGANGMSLFESGAEPVHIPVSNRSEVFDVTGAGDTVVAVFTLARIAGGSFLEAAHLANVAGGLAVRRSGATPVEIGELREELQNGVDGR
jgi:rfaE bifunctional protein kinase chain/domain